MMLRFIIRWLKRLLTRQHEQPEQYEDARDIIVLHTREMLMSYIDLKDIPAPIIHNPELDKTLLIVSGSSESIKLIELDLDKIFQESKDIKYKIVLCNGLHAGKIAYKYILDHKVDKALCDITLSNDLIEFNNGEYMILDGIDIASAIIRRNADCQIAICSTHNMCNTKNRIEEYADKFKSYFNFDISKVFINILSNNRTKLLGDFLSNKSISGGSCRV